VTGNNYLDTVVIIMFRNGLRTHIMGMDVASAVGSYLDKSFFLIYSVFIFIT
jgi:hypothetical protein